LAKHILDNLSLTDALLPATEIAEKSDGFEEFLI
jgi:hypothetical protein